jgi:hypothetical protein
MTQAHFALMLIIGMQSVDASVSKVLASTDARASEAGVKRGSCWMLSGDLKAGDRISLAQVVEAPCRTREGNKVQEARQLVGYDRSTGQAVMRQDGVAGAYLGRIALERPTLVQAQSVGTLLARVGAVEVSRTVDVRQSGTSGGQVFVSLPGGEVISVQVEPETRPSSGSFGAGAKAP